MNAATLGAPMHFSGVGLHTGEIATMDVRPARRRLVDRKRGRMK